MANVVILGALSAVLVLGAVWLVVRAVQGSTRGAAGRAAIDPFAVPEPWRRTVADALTARRRFGDAVGSMGPGPLRDRMADVGERLDDGVESLWEVARRGSSLGAARRRIDVAAIEKRLATATDTPTADALRAQLDTARRLDGTIEDTERRLGLLVARFQQAATAVEELAVHAEGHGDIAALDAEVTDAASEVDALRDALDEARAAGGPARDEGAGEGEAPAAGTT